MGIEHGKGIVLAKSTIWVDEGRSKPFADAVRQAFLQLGFGVVDAKVPVTATLVEAVLALEKGAFDV